MKNEFYQHKKSDKIKWVITGIAFVIVFAMLAGVLMQLFMKDGKKPSDWFKKPETEQTTPIEDENGGAIVNESNDGNGIKLSSKKIARASYAAEGISPQAETAYTVTATVNPNDAADKSVDWAVSWVNASSAWAQGKTVTDYVTITPNTETVSVNVACVNGFGEQIQVTATSRDNPAVSARCTVDYAQRVTDVYLLIGDTRLTNGGTTTVDFQVSMGVYGGGGKIQVGYTLSDTYTVAEEIDLSSSSFNISVTEVYMQHLTYDLTVDLSDPRDLTFDRRFFFSENGLEVTWYRERVHINLYQSFSSTDVAAMVKEFNDRSGKPNISFTVGTKYGGNVSFSSTLKLNAVNTTSVTSVNLDKSNILF